MIKCEVCEKECKNSIGLSSHIKIHKIPSKEYYDKYLKKENEEICPECGKETNYYSISVGYYKYCSCKCSNNSKEKKDNIKKTFNIIYGGHPLQNEKIQDKIKQTWKKMYGGHPFQNEKVQDKFEKTSIKNWGVKNPSQSKKVKEKVKHTKLENQLPKVIELLEDNNLQLLSDYNNCQELIKLKCLKCDLMFETQYFYIQQRHGKCPRCFPKFKSSGEIELLEFIKSIEQSEIIENSRDIIFPYELDIYIPEKNIAIEFNGLYWHSESNNKDKYYHLNKTEECLKNDIQLIHIFEDEWIFKQKIVKSRLRQLLNLNNDLPKIYYGKCEINQISSEIKNEFLNKYHIQEEDKSIVKLGAFYENELISVMTFSKESRNVKDIYKLSRFCSNSNYHIPGIAGKLLSYFKKRYMWKEIFSYVDRRWSGENLYKQIGFELDSITEPNYWYTKGFNRIYKWELRQQEGYYRIWDCGHYKFKMVN